MTEQAPPHTSDALRARLRKVAHHENPEHASKRKILSEDSQTFIASTVTIILIVLAIAIWGLIPVKETTTKPPTAAATTAK